MTTITAAAGGLTTSPVAVDGYEATRASQNIVHDLISGDIAVTLISPRPRSGTLQLVYGNAADAFAAFTLHETETTFFLERDDLPALNMTYVLDGDLTITVDDSREAWVLAVGFQEVRT